MVEGWAGLGHCTRSSIENKQIESCGWVSLELHVSSRVERIRIHIEQCYHKINADITKIRPQSSDLYEEYRDRLRLEKEKKKTGPDTFVTKNEVQITNIPRADKARPEEAPQPNRLYIHATES